MEIPRVRSCKPFCSYDLEVHDPPWLQDEVPTPAILLQNGDREFANDFVLPIWLPKFRYKMTLGPRDPTSIFIQKTSATKWYLDDGPPLASTYLHFSHACLCKIYLSPACHGWNGVMILEKKLTNKHFYIHNFERKESAFNNPNFYDLPLFVPQTGLPVGFYLRKKVTGHAGGRAGPGWARIWLCWARWAVVGRGIWPCWACWAGLGKVVVSEFWLNWFTCTVWGLCWYHCALGLLAITVDEFLDHFVVMMWMMFHHLIL